MCFDEAVIDLLVRVLILPDNNGVPVLPQKQAVSFAAVQENIFFEREVVEGIG